MKNIFLNPKNPDFSDIEPKDRVLLLKTIDFFENNGKIKLKDDDHDRLWYSDFLDFQSKNKIFSTFLTPSEVATRENQRWDTFRNSAMSEILGFYGLHFWYTWQVSILGLGPLYMTKNAKLKKKTAKLLDDGGIFAFGLSEKEHGADIYSTDMMLKNNGDGNYIANGLKYYIGNGNKAALVSIFGKVDPPWDAYDKKYGSYVFFAVDSQHENYECIKNVVNVQSYVAEFELKDYPINEDDIIAKGREAWDASLNTVNVGKFNLGWASIGICEHAFYESITHANNRILYGRAVTKFPHVKQFFIDAYCRLYAMKLMANRGIDYMRSASAEDRRYLLYDPIVKMKVTTQGEEVINLLWDVIAAKGFEMDTYFEMAARDIRALPKLEGTAHVNMLLIMKFMVNFFINHNDELPEIIKMKEPIDDTYLFNQSKASGLGSIQFHNYEKIYGEYAHLPNVTIFVKQLNLFKYFGLSEDTQPSPEQMVDTDFSLLLGELFTLCVYGQCILEESKLTNVDDDIIDQIFDFLVRDFSKFALQLYSKNGSTIAQQNACLKMIMKQSCTEEDISRSERIWKEVEKLDGAYDMNK
ncbi:acyl-CoA dehydrogenase [Candidatus Neomarinimicrobiota bacterium]